MAKRERFINPDAHRPVNWNAKAVAKALAADGELGVQTKKDGFRIHAWSEQNGTIRIVTREGIEILALEQAKLALGNVLSCFPAGYVVDGEVVVPGIPFEEASGHLRRHDLIELPVEFHLWDVFTMAQLLGTLVATEPSYVQRYDDLSAALLMQPHDAVFLIDMAYCTTMDQIMDAFADARERGEEGAVVKRLPLPVRNGKVTGHWKLKPDDTCDGRITGVLWGTPGLGNAGLVIGFTVELEDGTLCDVTNIKRAQMLEFTNAIGLFDGGVHPYLGRYVEISFMEKTANGSLRHPSFKVFRDLNYAPGVKA